ncbi:hypothetical protein ASPSYDRAFT_54814 [Aspergillus sydowii CBS 593.65]|uniref:SUN domain-containing protein n=1 Tax=Aspergillus sydowii CBS 593.65 TaxID=1036612 RepID=A0A1L9TR12_9EURO|nr:uncharacterized protein ASPSYDRAFT_54814 [Aspergillus sydowii CBS 593.65]OJJ61851.1 hypothetical protein ASPSYDRAFT_54814 [Aspergillus sydowii CBS 593.65]
MPPKKAANRRAGAVASSGSPSRRSTRLSPGLGGSALPNIPTKQSFAYGSSSTPILPHTLAAKPHKNLEEMADSIEDAVQTAKEREISSNSPSVSTRSRRKSSAERTPPPRRPRRQPTPDEVQLQASLDEASSAAPSTPTRHTFSSDGSPPREVVATHLYPRIMQREASPTQVEVPFDSHMHGDNSSVISYNVERDVHDDDLRRTRSNITAPPRRFSGLAFAQNPIEEEDEPTDHGPSRSGSAEQSVHEAPARTIIPDHSYVESHPEEDQYGSPRRPPTNWEDPSPKDGFVDWTLRFSMVAFVFFGCYIFGSMIYNRPYPPSNGAIRFNNTDLDALSNQVVHLGSQVSSLSRDVRSVRAEISSIPAPTTVFQHPSGGRQELAKTNFLSMGHGVIIDPYMTSPTVGRQLTSFQRFYMWLAGDKHMQPQPPLAALTQWEDFGECWCSAPRKGMSQLAILLGQRIIPEDVVVEHLPKAATIRPGVAPQEMELWARYRYVGKGSRPYRWSVSSFLRGSPQNIAGQDALPSDRRILHAPVMEALRIAWRGEPDEAFSDDKLLGEDFYRISKWRYDINESNNIQRFPVTAVIDSDEIRVDKVVFRVNSNWGGNETCIYRLKMHGKM